jgi:hypothetical protein
MGKARCSACRLTRATHEAGGHSFKLKYTVYELNKMREKIRVLYSVRVNYRSEATSWGGMSMSDEAVERELLTYMMNETTPEDIQEEITRIYKEKNDAFNAAYPNLG